MQEIEVGKVVHYFSKAGVAAVVISGDLKIGDAVHIKGHTTDFTQKIVSMQIDHKEIQAASPGDDVGLKVSDHVREHDVVYKVLG